LLRLNRDIIESYLTAFEVLKQKCGTTEEQKFLLQQMVKEGVQRVEHGEQYKPECVSTQNFSNALKLMENLELLKLEKNKELLSVVVDEFSSSWDITLEHLKHFHELVTTPIEDLLN
jgi:hypothetical protein